ncbi:hypothetical protein Bca4012_026518 [Brassica carinata]
MKTTMRSLFPKRNSSVGVSKERELNKKKTEKEEEAEKKGKEEVKKKREKKVYDLLGQKRDQPDEVNGVSVASSCRGKDSP